MKRWIFLFITVMLASCASSGTQHQAQMAQKTKATEPAKAKHPVSLANMDTRFLYLAYQQALEDKQYGLAIRFLKALIEKDPDTPALRFELVELYLSSGKEAYVKQALQVMQAMPPEAVDKLEGDMLARYQLLYARTLILNGDTKQAVKLLYALLKAQPENTQVRLLLIQHEARQGNMAQAHKLADAGLKQGDDLRLYEAKVHLLLQQKAWDKADALLAYMQTQYPDREAIVLQRGRLAVRHGQTEKAETLLKAYIDKHTDSAAQALSMLADLYVQQDKLEDAVRTYQRLLPMTGHAGAIYMSLGRVYYQTGEYAKASDAFAHAVQQYTPPKAQSPVSDTLASAYFYQAASLEADGQKEQAKALYHKLAPKHRLFVEAQLRLATIDIAQQRYTQAESRLLELRQQYPENMEVYALLSTLRLQQKQYAKLIDETAPALNQGFSSALWFNRAVAFDALKQYAQVDSTLTDLLKHEPDHAEALNFYGYSLADRGIRLDEALAMVQKALKAKPKDGYYLDSLAWVYFKQGKYAKAVEVQQRALKLVPDDAVMQEHMGDMYWKTAQYQKAKAHWQKALELEHDTPSRIKKKLKQGLI